MPLIKSTSKKAFGGLVIGPGTSTSDSIPTMLSNGEYVLNARATAKYGQAMATIANTYARAVNPKGLPHEAVVADTLNRLSSAQGPEALNAILDVMQQEIELAEKSKNNFYI